MKKQNSAFAKWFEEQAGKPPEGNYSEAKSGLSIARWQLARAEDAYRAHKDYELKRQFALYAWCARDKK